jgi:small GTP-binding protein
MSLISKKICIIGDFGVGKTSLIRYFVEGRFSENYLTTVGVRISRKILDIELTDRVQKIQLLIWDIEGKTKFKGIAPSYLQGARGAIIVGDLARQETIEHISEHLNLFNSINPKSSTIVALNKSDLVSPERTEKILEVNNFTRNQQVISTYVTSARNGSYVEEMFAELSAVMLAKTDDRDDSLLEF